QRLAHLLELLTGEKPGSLQSIPLVVMNFFMKITSLIQQSDRLISEAARLTSPILKARQFPERLEMIDLLDAALQELNLILTQSIEELKNLDHQWAEESPDQQAASIPSLQRLYTTLAYTLRWQTQLNERKFQLANS
ncbi:MAG: hypothetical protein SFY81_10210, partial [Verrucomicrobiota bacterium]|nr:hypothetical protein [Verrucomicrobiota bacterium]